MLSISQLHLQLPFDNCPTVAAADIDSVCVCVYATRGAVIAIASPKYVPGNYCQFINDYPYPL